MRISWKSGRTGTCTVQLLHCLRTADDGGDTGLVDGFAAAAELRATDREAFDLMAGIPVPFGYQDKSTELRASQPRSSRSTAPAGGGPGCYADLDGLASTLAVLRREETL